MLYIILRPFVLTFIYPAIVFISNELFGPLRLRFPQTLMFSEWAPRLRMTYHVLFALLMLSDLLAIYSVIQSINYIKAVTGKERVSLHDAVEMDTVRTKVYISRFQSEQVPYLPGYFQSGPAKWGLIFGFERASGNAFWSVYAERSEHDNRGFSLESVPGYPESWMSSTRDLGCIMFASPLQVVAEAKEFRASVELVGENWETRLFEHIKEQFDARNRTEAILAPEYVKFHQVWTGGTQHLLVILFKHEQSIKRIKMDATGSVNEFLDDVSFSFGNEHHFEEERTVFLYVIEHENDQPSERWSVMLWLLGDADKSAECYVIKTLCESNGTVQGFAISHWDGIPGGYAREYFIGMVKSISARTLIERYVEKHVEFAQRAGRNYSLVEFSLDYFDSLWPIDPSVQDFADEQSTLERNVTIYFYTQYLNGSEGGFLSHLKPFVSMTGSLVRHWGIMFELDRVDRDDANLPERFRYITISGDNIRFPFEHQFTVRLHHGKPDENARGFYYEKLATTKMSLKQIFDYSSELLDVSLTGSYVLYYNLFHVNCHEWARDLYSLIAKRHDLPPLGYRLTALHAYYVIDALLILVHILTR